MRRRLLALILGIGAVVGFGSGISELRWRHWARREAFERHIAEICVDAARSGQVPPAAGRSNRRDPRGTTDW